MSAETIDQIILQQPQLATVTVEKVKASLAETGLEPAKGWVWLTRAITGALYASMSSADEAPDRPENAAIREELNSLADQIGAAWIKLESRSREADAAIFDYAFCGWDPTSGYEAPPAHSRFLNDVAALDRLSVFLRRSATTLGVQRQRWRDKARREERIYRAQCLSVVYSLAFNAEPTVNNWETAKHLGPWAEFYQRIVALVFGERVTPDRVYVLKEARRRDKAARVVFGPGILPN